MSQVLLTVSTLKPLGAGRISVEILALDEETNAPLLSLRLTAEDWWDLVTGRALPVENFAGVKPLTDARIQRLRDQCSDETMPAGHLRRRVLAILDDKGWGKT